MKGWPAALLVALPALAIWAPMGQPVPVERALANVRAQLKDHPNDASLWLVLGRLESYAFFVASPQVPMRRDRPYFSDLPETRRPKETGPEDLAHLRESIQAFRKAISLDANQPLPYLGLGWDLEQGARYSNQTGANPGDAVEAYRQAYRLASKDELAMRSFSPGYQSIAIEAAHRLIELQQDRPESKPEVEKLEKDMALLREKPRAITPVIFSFREGAHLRDLVAPDVHVPFDLDGFGPAQWSWLKPSTGILVWDPRHSESIDSGLQLFGSVTWWMFWRDGYQALAALDDNRDGWLSGAELDGIAVWIDRNQNGHSDPGEVISLAAAGIARIGVSAVPDATGVLANSQGIEFADGRRTASFDWIAVARTSPPKHVSD